MIYLPPPPPSFVLHADGGPIQVPSHIIVDVALRTEEKDEDDEAEDDPSGGVSHGGSSCAIRS